VIVAGPGPAELADSLSMAFPVLLEALSPVERAVFMLREVLGYGYPDVARIAGKTEVNCRQIFVCARHRIAAGAQARDSAQPPARQAEGDYDRLASPFTYDGAVRMPYVNAGAAGPDEIRAWGERAQALVDYFVQTTPGHDPA
jgi:hypothetical protein